MTETFVIRAGTKRQIYEQIIPQITSLMDATSNAVANMANTTSVLKGAFSAFSWVGFYVVDGDGLVLGPFQGKPACVRIAPGRGVCGTAFSKRETIVVPDVSAFPDHIACDPDSQSEIVVPVLDGERCYGVLDIDSYQPNNFDDDDARYLTVISNIVAPFLRKELMNAQATDREGTQSI